MNKIKEGDLFKRIELHGRVFEIRYGYYADYERDSEYNEPMPIYPDFKAAPEYTADGFMFVTRMQDQCPHGVSRHRGPHEACCVECPYFLHGDELIGICRNEFNKTDKSENGGTTV